MTDKSSAPSSSKLETPHVHDWHEIDAWGTQQCRICKRFDTEAEAAPKPAESPLEVYSKLLVDTRQFLVDAQLSFVDQIRKIDTLIGDIPRYEKEISIAPFGLDNDHI